MEVNDQHNSACLSVVIPAYNEEKTLTTIVRKVLTIPQLLEIVIVDDCSTDHTPEIAAELAAKNPQVRLIRQPKNAGKTEALKVGFAATRGEIVLVQDADLEYDPAEIPDVIQPILDGHADVVYGSRFLVRKAARVLYFYHYIASPLESAPDPESYLHAEHVTRRSRQIERGSRGWAGRVQITCGWYRKVAEWRRCSCRSRLH